MSKILKNFLIFLFLLGLGFCSSEKNASSGPLRILALGDSLTEGVRVPENENYPSRLEKILNENGYEAKVINAGVRSETTAQILARLDKALDKGPFNWVLLSAGANDGLRNRSVKEMKRNLEKMITKITDSGAKVFLMGMKLPLHYQAKYRISFEDVYLELAKEQEVLFYPFMLEGVAQNRSLNLPDNMHPNGAGYKVIAENIFKALEPHLSN